MKQLILLVSLLLATHALCAQESIGEEIVVPLNFPKFSLTGEYNLNRKFHGFTDERLRSDINRRFDSTLAFEAGLLKYFNAGGLFGVGISGFQEPISIRMGLFAKPFVPLGDRFALFSRISGGLAVDLAFYPYAHDYYASFDKEENFKRVFKGQSYNGVPFGGFGSATLGLEVFPFSRFGVALEWGIRASIFHNRKSMWLVKAPSDIPGAPGSFNFMIYEFPFMLTLHVII